MLKQPAEFAVGSLQNRVLVLHSGCVIYEAINATEIQT